MMNPFEWSQASSIDQAVAQLGDGVALKAGGVDLLDLMKENLASPKRVVNLRTIRELDGIEEDAEGLSIGPLVTLAQLEAHPVVRQKYTVLADACGKAATPQIRNMATVGGNLLQRPRCWYFRHADFHCRKKGGQICFAQGGENQYHAIFQNGTCAIVHPSGAATALVALGAEVTLQSAPGSRKIALERFFTPPNVDISRENSLKSNEVLTRIRVPKPADGSKFAYTKVGEKESFDWPIAEVAVVLDMDGKTVKRSSIILGAAAPIPRRARDAEATINGKPLDEALAREAAQAAMADASPMSQNGYKVPLFETVIRRTLMAAAGA